MTNAHQNSQNDYHLGLQLKRSGRIDEALAVFQALSQLLPDHPGAAFQSGCLLMLRGEYHAALSYFLQMEQYYPDHPEMLSNMGTCYLQLNKMPDAASCYLKALQMLPEDTQLLFNLGVISMKQGRTRVAIDYYTRAVKVEPGYFAAHHNLAVVLLAMQKVDEALLHFHAALRVEPGNAAVKYIIDALEQRGGITKPPEEYISSLFDAYADYYDPHLIQTLQYAVPQVMHDLVVANAVVPDGGWKILDLGCGTGLCGQLFRSAANWLAGVDLSGGMLAQARSKQLFDELVQSDMAAFLNGCQYTVDLILAGDVLVYHGELEGVMSGVSRVLCDQGWFVFSAEICETQDYRLTASGRFAHSRQYLERVARRYALCVVECRMGTLRTQYQSGVAGNVYLMQKLSVPLSSMP